jgi:hypothetical protein
MQLETDPNPAASAGDAIAAYHDGTAFTRDYWVEDRIGAQAGALVEVYNEVNLMAGMTGMGAARGRDNIVVKPGPFDRWSDATTSPGTPTTHGGPGWNPLGATYRYDYSMDHPFNAAVWTDAGCPKANGYGEWANGGLPLAYVRWTWENPTTRGESPMPRRRGGGRR